MLSPNANHSRGDLQIEGNQCGQNPRPGNVYSEHRVLKKVPWGKMAPLECAKGRCHDHPTGHNGSVGHSDRAAATAGRTTLSCLALGSWGEILYLSVLQEQIRDAQIT